MENAEALRNALQKLTQRRASLGAELQQRRDRLAELDNGLRDLQKQRSELLAKIETGQVSYEKMDDMINQTEEGYRQMLDTAQTLMDVVAMQMPEFQAHE